MANATQRANFVGVLTSLKRGEVKTFESGTKYVDYSSIIRLNSGVSIFNKKRFFNPDNLTDFSQKTIDELEALIELLDDAKTRQEKIFVTKRVAPTKDKVDKKIMANTFDSFTSYLRDDGTIGFGTEGDIKLIDPERVREVEFEDGSTDFEITFDGKNNTEYTKYFKEIKNDLEISMVLSNIDFDRRLLTFETLEENYPKTIIAELIEGKTLTPENCPKIGQGYNGNIIFIKGEKVDTASVVTDDGWDTEAKEKAPQYEPDRIVINISGFVKDLTKEIKAKPAKGAKASAGKPQIEEF